MYLACHQYTIHSLFLFTQDWSVPTSVPLLFFNRKLNDSINDTVNERTRHLSRIIFTNFCLAKLQDGKLLRHCTVCSTFSFEFVKPVKTTIGIKSVLGYGKQTITEP